MIKVGNRYVGENPEEQLKIERRRFEQRQKSKLREESLIEVKMQERGEGNKKLSDF